MISCMFHVWPVSGPLSSDHWRQALKSCCEALHGNAPLMSLLEGAGTKAERAQGSNRAQKFRRFLGFFLFFNGILMPIWGFNYSKMPN